MYQILNTLGFRCMRIIDTGPSAVLILSKPRRLSLTDNNAFIYTKEQKQNIKVFNTTRSVNLFGYKIKCFIKILINDKAYFQFIALIAPCYYLTFTWA